MCAKKTGSSSGLSTNSLTAGSIVSNARSVTGRRPSTASDSIARGRQGRGQLEETEDVDDDMTLSQGIYIGERSIAAHVVRDNYRTARDAANGNLGDKKFSKSRRLWLEVVWQKASSEACKPYELKAGVVIERIQSQIEKFEVFRVPWVEEPLRRPLREELTALAECYLDYE